MGWIRVAAWAVAVLTVIACGGSNSQHNRLVYTITPLEREVKPGQTATYDFRVTSRMPGTQIELSVSGLPPGTTGGFEPPLLRVGESDSVLRIVVDPTAPERFGNITANIREIGGSSSSRVLGFNISKTAGDPTFRIELNPVEKRDFRDGESFEVSFVVRADVGFSGPVEVTATSPSDDYQVTQPVPGLFSVPPNRQGTFSITHLPIDPVDQDVLITVSARSGSVIRRVTFLCRSDDIGGP